MALEDILNALMQSTSTQQQSQQSGGGADALSQLLGGLLGGSQQGGGSPASQVLGGLEQLIGSQSSATSSPAADTGDPLMVLLQPLVNKVAAKVNISPAIATIIVSIALKYLLKSHPSTPDQPPLDLGNVMQTLASGGQISQSTLQSSGMLNEVVRTTGLDEQQAVRSINTTFGVLGTSLQRVNTVKGGTVQKSTSGVKGKASVTRKRR